ncbi:UNKNOWN [Stylonychia lemnae]|uniref:Uncharacterized protein n=1 Tax=Stylonychia lemnae TaxID=5949 RepID=A0A078A4L6_STYLE|nr:UNKNOWN [Stylonychia lemnae]|eukprot:CDW77198.1 UNKNOWN [Stylonychia lemnae]
MSWQGIIRGEQKSFFMMQYSSINDNTLQMEEKPMVINKYKPQEHNFRDVDNDKNLGPKVISPNRWQSERQRIQETQDKNKIYFFEAFNDKNKVCQMRERQADKEIQPEMKYTAKNTLEKVADALMNSIMVGGDKTQDFGRTNESWNKNGDRRKGNGHNKDSNMGHTQAYGGLFSNFFSKMTASLPDLKQNQVQIGKDNQNDLSVTMDTQSEYKGGKTNKKADNTQATPEKGKVKLSTSAEKFFNAMNPKQLRPDLHNKTHFKAAMTLRIMKPVSLQRENHYQTMGPGQYTNRDINSMKRASSIKKLQPLTFQNPLLAKQKPQTSSNQTYNLEGQAHSQVLNDLRTIQLHKIEKKTTKLLRFDNPDQSQMKKGSTSLTQLNRGITDVSAIVDKEEDDHGKKIKQREIPENYYEVSQNVLSSCHIIPQISPKYLKKGDGKLISNASMLSESNLDKTLQHNNMSLTKLLNSSKL